MAFEANWALSGELCARGDNEGSTRMETQQKLKEILSRLENTTCADCNAQSPKWASVSHGCTICTKCAGVHRSLGVHISFVISCTLDNWTLAQLQCLDLMGNKKSNEKLENGLPSPQLKPQFDSSWEEREAFIRAKYEKQLFCQGASAVAQKQQEIDSLTQQMNCIPGHTFALTSDKTLEGLKRSSNAPRKSSSTYGMVEYIGVLIVELIEGVDVSKYNKNDRSDLFVTLRLGEQMVTSNTIKNDFKPRWNQKLLLSWDGLSPLKVELHDRKRFHSSRSLGGFIVDSDLLQLLIEADNDGSNEESNRQSTAIDSWHQVSLTNDERTRYEMQPACSNNHSVPLYPRNGTDESAHEPLRKMIQKMSKNVTIRKLLRAHERTDKTVGLIHLRLALQKF